ncbi:MAG TPA: hypothetical protein VIR31_04370, partial [Nitrososphaeraceae archaeon]
QFNRLATIILYDHIKLGPSSRGRFIYSSNVNVGHLTMDLCIELFMFKSIPYIWLMLHGGF